MSLLNVSGISKKEETGFQLHNIVFTQNEFQKIAIAGATGSGKTTLLKIIAGLIQPDNGIVYFNETRLKGPEEKLIPGHPQIAYLSQHFELRNNYRVEELLEMANKLTPEEAQLIFNICRIDHLLKRWTNQLSGGEKQRIALARLLITAPKILLLDEPYSNLDAIHKNILKTVIENISQTLKITCLLVSHDPVDVLSWADEIIVLNNGMIVQKDAPQQVYLNPFNEYVAALFGKYIILTPALARAFADYTDIEIDKINSFIRPQHFIITTSGKGLKGKITRINFNGFYNEIEIQIGSFSIISYSNNSFNVNDDVYVNLQMSE